ncbi:MAG: YdeI/OmpD-associated family protein [Candidatus Woesearchaeota archaeon]
MTKKEIITDTLHKMPADIKKVLDSNTSIKNAWDSLTPLARNEWICWTISVKKEETRAEHVERLKSDLLKGKRRPCCWMGCVHRKDKKISPSQKYILDKIHKKK